MSTMSRVAGVAVTSVVLSHVVGVLADSRLSTVTRDEFALLSCPEGQLYDKSVIDRSATLTTFSSTFLGHFLRDDLINPVKMSVRPSVRTSVRPQ